jgi:sodium-coupled monocarboxylate transporter 8/12
LPEPPGAGAPRQPTRRRSRLAPGLAISLILAAVLSAGAAEGGARERQPGAPEAGTAPGVTATQTAAAAPREGSLRSATPTLRTASAAQVVPPRPPRRPFSTLDYAIFAVYLVASVAIGLLFTTGQETLKDYFLAGRGIHSIIVAISVLAALFSGISYLGAPAELYSHSITFMLVGLSFFIATPLTNLVFMPFFYRANFYTAYQYLEARFSVGVRTLSSALFIIRVLIWLALATYAPALALEQVTGFPLWLTILLTGVLTTLYTALGGMKAVIWTDVMQFVVLVGGQIAIFVVALGHIPDGVMGVYRIGQAAGKFDLSLSLDPSVRVTLWGVLIGGAFMNLVQMATDQVSVQRYLTATNLKEARRALWIKLALTLPVVAIFYLSGIVLFAFYQTQTDPLAAGWITKADQILPYFVMHELPTGMPGVLIAAIYAASMSTVSAGINSLTTASLVDFYQRLWRPNASSAHLLRLAKWLSLFYGVLIVLLAFVVERLGSLIEASNKAIGLVGGPLLGLFLLGMFSRRANATGAILGWFAGVLVLLPVCFLTKTSFLWYALLGSVTTFVVGLACSLLLPAPTAAQIEGLVVGRPGAADGEER